MLEGGGAWLQDYKGSAPGRGSLTPCLVIVRWPTGRFAPLACSVILLTETDFHGEAACHCRHEQMNLRYGCVCASVIAPELLIL